VTISQFKIQNSECKPEFKDSACTQKEVKVSTLHPDDANPAEFAF
jgi:hypothetical protein